MKVHHPRRLYLPAFTIVVGVILLLLLISISTFRNLNREKEMQMNFVHRRGLTLLRALEAGARAGMIMPMWGEDAVGRLIHETGKDEDIAYIYLLDDDSTVVHHSLASLAGARAIWRPNLGGGGEVVSNLRELADGSQIYDMAKRFDPRPPERVLPEHHPMMQVHGHSGTVIVLGQSMKTYEAARRSDMRHALMMAAIVVALGSGALFFIFVIQNYYLVGRALKETQDYTRQVVSNMADGLLGLDSKGAMVSYNQLALDLLGLDESGMVKKDLRSVIDFEATGIAETLARGKPVNHREILFRKNGFKPLPLSFSVTPLEVGNGPSNGAVVVIRDLSEIKRLEEKVRHAEKLAAMGKLAATVAHEIRNPLSSIKGFSQFFRNLFKEGSKEREYAGIMVKEVDRMNSVVKDLLIFARPAAPEPVFTDVKGLIGHTLRLVQGDATARKVKIQNHPAEGLNPIALDPSQMTQALLNLLLNALHAVEKGGTIEVEAALDDTEHNLLIRVMDDGPGVPQDLCDKIFEPFFTTREKGTGLGLAIVHQIVSSHSGRIDVTSPPPGKRRGTCFTITLPQNKMVR